MTYLTDRISRRTLMAGGGAAVVALGMPSIIRPARAADTLVVGDAGGAYTTAWAKAFYEPFEKETGIKIIPVERRDNPAAEIRAVVETGNYKWDLCASIGEDVAFALTEANMLERLNLSGPDTAQIPDTQKNDHFIASDVGAFILAYHADSFSEEITSFADMWDVERLSGRRALRQLAKDTIPIALIADGATLAEVPEILSTEAGWKRAFDKLDVIKPHINVWWNSAAQTPTLLQSKEVDMCATFNARAQTVIDAGVPVKISWDGGFYTNYGWVIPRGNPKADLARQFISYCSNAERQALACAAMAIGPSNPKAFDFIPADRSVNLPTYKENFPKIGPADFRFWGPIQSQAAERFNDWLLQ